MNVRTVVGIRPRVLRGEPALQIDTLLGEHFKIMHNDTANVPELPFADNTCYVGHHVTDAPPRRADSRSVNLGYFRKYCGWRTANPFTRPTTTRSKPSEEVIMFQFNKNNRVKGLYYVPHNTLILANMGYDYRTFANIEEIVNWIRTYIGPLPVMPVEYRAESIARLMLTVGADPEFEILNDALSVIQPNHELFNNRLSAEIGLDGAGSQLEFRPHYGTVDEVVADIRRLMKRVRHRICTTGHTYALGGHIHIGYGFRYRPPSELTWLLDQYLGMVTWDLSGLARGHYKCLSAIEDKPWGFEYRSCPAAIFDTPKLAELSMKIAHNICERFGNAGVFRIRQYGVGRDEYVNYGVLTDTEYEEWKQALLSYPYASPHDCRLSWAPENELTEPLERARSPEEIRAEQQRQQEIIRQREADHRRHQEEMRREQEEHDRVMAERQAIEGLINEAAIIDTMGLLFDDDWVPDVLRAVRDRIRAHTQDPIRLFGLGQNRGAVTYGYDVDGYDRISAEGAPWSRRFGMPWRVRVGHESLEVVHRHVDGILYAHDTMVAVGIADLEPVSIERDLDRAVIRLRQRNPILSQYPPPVEPIELDEQPDPPMEQIEQGGREQLLDTHVVTPEQIADWAGLPRPSGAPVPTGYTSATGIQGVSGMAGLTSPTFVYAGTVEERRQMFNVFLTALAGNRAICQLDSAERVDDDTALEMLRLRRRQLGLRVMTPDELRRALECA